MAFGDDFLKGFLGNDYLKDYRHASKTFRSNGYELAPRQKFLFYVRFNINTTGIPGLKNIFGEDKDSLSLLVKSAELPSYQIDTQYNNQYNRKRLTQSKINYQPVNIRFHDDGSDFARNLWFSYFNYYYKDAYHQYGNASIENGAPGTQGNSVPYRSDYNGRDTYDAIRTDNDWGYIGESYLDGQKGFLPNGGKPRFFNDIVIYGMNQHKFAAYVLINPIITDYRHDTYDYSEGTGLMENTMTINYETVKYYSGQMDGKDPDTFVKGFGDIAHYDRVKSPLSRPGSTTSIAGPGGLLDAAGSIFDLVTGRTSGTAATLGAVKSASAIYQGLKNKNLRSVILEEANVIAQDVIRGKGPGQVQEWINTSDSFFFGKTTGETNPTANQPATPKSASNTDEAYEGPQRVQFVGLEDD